MKPAGQVDVSCLPSLELFTTYLRSNRQVADRHDLAFRLLAPYRQALQVKDVASDREAKRRWQQKNAGNSELPCLLVNGVRIGDIADLQLAVDDGKLEAFLRLNNPPARPSFDDDLESLDSDQVDELLASYADDYERPKAIVPPETPPATPKVVNVTPVMQSKPFNAASFLPPTPPDTPQTLPEAVSPDRAGPRLGLALQRAGEAAHGRTDSMEQAALPSVQEKSLALGLGSPLMRPQPSIDALKATRQRSQSSLRSLCQLPPLPPSASSTSSFPSREHKRSLSSMRNVSAPLPSSQHKKQQDSLADLVAAIDDILTPEHSPAPSTTSRRSLAQQQRQRAASSALHNIVTDRENEVMREVTAEEGGEELRRFLTNTPNVDGPVREERPPTPTLNDPSGFAAAAAAERERKRSEARGPPVTFASRPASRARSTTPTLPKKGGFFSCCGSNAAMQYDA